MQKKFLLIITIFTMLFAACKDEDDDSYTNSSNETPSETIYCVKNQTGSTITDVNIYELDTDNATISSKHYNSCDNGDYVSEYYFQQSFTANKDATYIKVSYKIAGQTYSNTFTLRKGDRTEIIIERPANLTTYSVEFNVLADWDDDDYLYYVSVSELNSNYSVIQNYDYSKVYGLGTVLDEVKANANTKTVVVYFYFYPDRGTRIYSSKEFQIIKGEHNKLVVYGSECSKNPKSTPSNPNLKKDKFVRK